MKIAVFASGNGSNFQVIAEQFPVEFVFSDHRDVYVLERAKNLGVVSHAFELQEFDNKAAYEEAIVKLLDEYQIDLVCLAGYMKIVGPTLLAAYEGRIINIHPAYLPEFPGAHGIEDAWNAGVAESGVTIHWVDSGVDTGKVIKQELVNGLAHITGGGFIENVPRMFSDDLAAEIDESKVPVLPIFKALEKYGQIKHEEMFEIFNMGIGLMLAVKPENVERVKELLDEPVYEIGRIVKKDGASVVIK